jgi:ABC-type bacteriocin/lantibiotic exporter with double-glycine peptidase domain
VILFGLGRGGIASAIRQSKAKYAAAGWLEDIAHNPNLFRSDGGPEFVAHHSDQIARDYLDASAAHFRILMGQSIGALSLHAVASTALLGLGGWMVIDRQLTLGQLVAAELVVSAMIYGLTRLGKTLENFYEMMAGLDKLGHLLDLPAE